MRRPINKRKKTGKNVSKRLKYRRNTRKKYLRYLTPEGEKLQKRILRNYWRFLTYNSDFHSPSAEGAMGTGNILKEPIGIVIVPEEKARVIKGVVDVPPFREIIDNISVIENSIVETAQVSRAIAVFADTATLYRLQKTLGTSISLSGHRYPKNIFYIPNTFLPTDMRSMIWYTFRYVNKATEHVSDNTYLKYFYHFCYESFDIANYAQMLIKANPVQSVIFESEGESFLANGRTPILLSAFDIFKIRRMKKVSKKEFLTRAYHARVFDVDTIHDFSTKEGIVDYIKSGDTYVENRQYKFGAKLTKRRKQDETNTLPNNNGSDS